PLIIRIVGASDAAPQLRETLQCLRDGDLPVLLIHVERPRCTQLAIPPHPKEDDPVPRLRDAEALCSDHKAARITLPGRACEEIGEIRLHYRVDVVGARNAATVEPRRWGSDSLCWSFQDIENPPE